MTKIKSLHRLFPLIAYSMWLLGVVAEAAEGQANIRGLIYVSPSGKLEGDLVMRAAKVDVMLLRAEGGFEVELEAIHRTRSATIEKQLQSVNRAQADFLRSTAAPREEQEKKSAILRQERAKLVELRQAYEKQVKELLAKHTIAKTETDSEGKFNFTGIPPGRYIIYARFEIVGMDIHYNWLLPVELQREKEVEVSLDKLNATTPLF